MTTREEAIAACLAMGGVYEDYPFGDLNWTLIRHEGGTHRAFAMIFGREGRIWINVKVTPEDGITLREVYPAVVPAYHMNKTHWVSVVLDGSMTDGMILPILARSYALTRPAFPRTGKAGKKAGKKDV